MSFDAHSLERLAALGRTLPSRLPPPAAAEAASAPAADAPRDGRRHRLETEQDPGRLFHELMQASSDGSVPPHLIERLRALEAPPAAAAGGATTAGTSGAGASGRSGRRGQGRRRQNRDPDTGPGDDALYTAFSQLLLEEEEDPAD